jgi:Tfp pilus assembly protein PilN
MIRINLLKPEKKEALPGPIAAPVKETVKAERPSSTPPLILLLTVVIIAALAFTQRNKLNNERSLLEDANAEKRKLQSVLQKLTQLEKDRTMKEQKVSLIRALQFRQDTAVKIMNALSQALPAEWVWLTEATYDGKTLKIRGRATNNTLIAEYVSALEKSGILQSVNPTDITQKTVRGQQYLEFIMTANVILPPGATLPTPPAPTGNVNPRGRRP